MRFRISLLILFLLPGIRSIQAQENDPAACSYIQKAIRYHCEKKFRKTIKTLSQFRTKYPDHSMAEEALYAEGMTFYEKGKMTKARKVFEELLSLRNYKALDTSVSLAICASEAGLCDRFFIQEDLVILQHEACINLAEIGFKTGDQPFAYESIVNADKYYRFWYGCGTGDLEENIRLSILYSRYYEKAGIPDSAISVMLKYALEPAAMPVRFYPEALERLVALIKQRYKPDEIKKLIEESVENVSVEVVQPNPRKTNRIYYISFLGVKILVAPVYLLAGTVDPEDVKKYIRGTDFYQKLIN